MARSYNRIELIGNLTHDPEVRATPKGNTVCSFRLATDRTWTDEEGKRKEETMFHRIVAWKTLAEQCAKFLRKGRKIFVAGRLAYRSYETPEGTKQQVAEIIIEQMLLLDAKPTEIAKADRSQGLEPAPISTEELADEMPL